jgi:cytochrome c peroxidase
MLCHGYDGRGSDKVGHLYGRKNLVIGTYNPTEFEKLIRLGGEALGRSKYMPPWKDELTEEQITDVLAYLTILDAPAERGKVVFRTNCILCHGVKGNGKGRASVLYDPPPANLTLSDKNEDYMRSIVTLGGKAMGRSDVMPVWGEQISADEIEDVIRYVRTKILIKPDKQQLAKKRTPLPRPATEDINTYLLPKYVPYPEDNKPTAERIALGKALFFDPRLSASNFISCASCHNPALGWSDGLKTANGHGMQKLDRSTPTILNTAFQAFQFWDGRARSLEEQAVAPIIAKGEMAEIMEELLKELNAVSGYRNLFEQAYPGEGINENTIARAIASFERTIISTESRFDRWLKGDKKALTLEEIEGFNLFKTKANCIACHSGFNFTDNGFHNIGLKSNDDDGRYKIKPVAIMKGAFKTPTLRDVALTAPYMHNGEYDTLEQVIEHYNRGGDKKDNLSPNIKALDLTKQEQAKIISFLRALTGKQPSVYVPKLPVNN